MGSLGGEHVSLKASLDDQSGLVEMDPKTFAPAAYTGRYGWVTVRLAGVGTVLARQLVTNAWKRTAPRRSVSDYELRISKLSAGTDFSGRRRAGGRSGAGA
jgi:hypothetical protein